MDDLDVIGQARKAVLPQNGMFIRNSTNPITGDSELVCLFPMPTVHVADAAKRLLDTYTDISNEKSGKPCFTVTDPVIGNETFKGLWRIVTNLLATPQQIQHLIGKPSGIMRTLAYGYAKTIAGADTGDFISGRVVRSILTNGNTEYWEGFSAGTDGKTYTTSNDPCHTLFVTFPNLDPAQMQAMALTLSDSYTSLKIKGVDFGGADSNGAWYCTMITPKTESDGSGTLDVVFSRAKLMCNGFEDLDGYNSRTVGTLHDVAETLAQPIVDAWKAVGVLGSSGVWSPAGEGRANVSLMVPATASGTADTGWIPITYNVWRRWHWAYRKTFADISTYIASFNGAITGTKADEVCYRDIQRTERGGFYDAIVTETKFGPHANNNPDFTITVATGRKITLQICQGWQLRKSEINDANLLALYDESVKGIGKALEFKVTRSDEWSFDYIATIKSQSASIEGSLNLSGGGETITPIHAHGVNLATEGHALEDKLSPGVRKDVSVQLKMRDDELADVIGVVNEVPAIGPIEVSSGSGGVSLVVGAVKDVDKETLVIPRSGPRTEVDASIQLGKHGEVSGSYKARSLPKSGPITKTTGDSGVGLELGLAKNVDAEDFDLPASGPRQRISGGIEYSESGAVSVKWSREKLQKVLQSLKIGATLAPVSLTIGGNIDPADLAFLKESLSNAEERDVSVTPLDDNTFRLISRIKTLIPEELASAVNTEVNGPLVVTSKPFVNKITPPTTADNEWISSLALRDTDTYDGILNALKIANGCDLITAVAIHARERQPHFTQIETKVREVVDDTATNPYERFKEMGQNIFSVCYQWYRDNVSSVVREYSLTPLTATATGENCNCVVRQYGQIWVRETRTDIIGEWVFEYRKWQWTGHISEEGVYT